MITFTEIIDTFVDRIDYHTFQEMHLQLETMRLGHHPYPPQIHEKQSEFL